MLAMLPLRSYAPDGDLCLCFCRVSRIFTALLSPAGASSELDPREALCALMTRFEENRLTHTSPLAPFASLFVSICEAVRTVVASEPKVVDVQSPVYVFGDLHGNYKDLMFYLQVGMRPP